MKEEILKLLGKKQYRFAAFDNVIEYSSLRGLYHYDGNLYCVKGDEEILFDDINMSDKEYVYDCIIKNKFSYNKKLQ